MTCADEMLRQAKEATDLAERAFASGDKVTGIAAVALASDLVLLARLCQLLPPPPEREGGGDE